MINYCILCVWKESSNYGCNFPITVSAFSNKISAELPNIYAKRACKDY